MAAKLSDIGKIIAQALASATALDAAGASIVESMQKRVRLGKGVKENDGEATPLPTLKPKTILNRKAFVEVTTQKIDRTKKDKFLRFIKGKKSTQKTKRTTKNSEQVDQEFFKVRKSNLTFTGKMIKSISYKAFTSRLIIFLKGNENERKATRVQELGFDFFNVSKAELNRAVKEMSKVVEEILSKIKFDSL